MSSDELLEHAKRARAFAYAPYSRLAVGAAVDVGNETVITGANVENASYGLSMCAERVAIGSAVAQGHRAILGIAIAGPASGETAPCGACRQVIAEFGAAVPVTFTTPDEPIRTTIAELLPRAFGPHDLP